MENKFIEIAQETIAAAGRIGCVKEEYRDGLEIIIAELYLALEAVRSEIAEVE